MTLHRLGSLPNLGTTPSVKRLPAELPAPQSEAPGVVHGVRRQEEARAGLARLDQMVTKAHVAYLMAEGSPEAGENYLKATLRAVAGYEKLAPSDPKHRQYCSQAIDLAVELGWKPENASAMELKAMRRAAQHAYAHPRNPEEKRHALELLLTIDSFKSGRDLPRPDVRTMAFPSDDGGQMPQIEAKTLAFPSDDGGQMPPIEAKTLAFPSDDGGQMPRIEAKTMAFPSDDGGQLPPIR